MSRIYKTFSALVTLVALALPCAHAASSYPGEAAAVIQYCGKPIAENHDTSPITGHMQRDLYYTDTILHFEPIETGWGFTSAWQGHLPISRRALEVRMPCFRAAMQAVAATPRQAVDPTIAMQTITPAVVGSSGFGISFLWLIFVLIVILIVVAALPVSRQQQLKKALNPTDREFRKPSLLLNPFRGKSQDADRLDL